MAKKAKATPKATPKAQVTKKAVKATPIVAAPVDENTAKLASKWQSYFNKAKATPTASYNMKNKYESETAINHKVLGWGYILDNKNDRLEVLFQNGIKYLISNYK